MPALKSRRKALAAAVAFVSGVIAISVPADSSAAPSSQTVTAAGCQSIQVSVSSVTPALGGSKIAVSVSAPATKRTFSNGSYQLLPPAGWSPLTATKAELTYYSIPPKPSNSALAQAWTTEMADWKPVPITPCISTAHVPSFTTNGGNYAGVVDSGATFNQTYGRSYVPTNYQGSCGSTNSNSAWVGLGGVSSPNLLQNGWTAATFAPSASKGPSGGISEFYEELDSQYPNNPPVWIEPGHISSQDTVSQYVQWSSSNSNTVTFNWHDLTNGYAYQVSLPNSSSFYSGSTADWIDEDQSGGGVQVRPYGQDIAWTNDSAISGSTTKQASGWTYKLLHTTGANGSVTQDLDGGINSTGDFNVKWENCG